MLLLAAADKNDYSILIISDSSELTFLCLLQSYPPPKRSRTIPGALPPMQQPQQPQQQQRAPEVPQAAQQLADKQQPTQKCRGRQKGSKHFNERPAQTVATAAKAFRESVHSVLANVVSADSRSNVVEPRGAVGAHGNPFRSGFFVFAVSQVRSCVCARVCECACLAFERAQ